ncbi:MAG: hypothetical protein HKN74_05260 [Acidimicrobiia bacterium]|nr:hypothetical protein [Acidimicrobiia bacterium]NNF09676.1 hypothetical protein [Acidimicrobiia bacterium]NNL68773.1 hypothetical protein [Acidimicrobiia bacterium]
MQTTHPTPSLDTGWLGVVRVLLVVQGGIAVLSTIEVTVAGAVLGPAIAPLIILNLAAAALTLIAARGVVRRSARSRRLAIVLEWTVLVFATIDLLLAIFLAKRGLEPVPLITRVVVPYLVIRLLRRRDVRAEFGLEPTRRQRRRDRKAASA